MNVASPEAADNPIGYTAKSECDFSESVHDDTTTDDRGHANDVPHPVAGARTRIFPRTDLGNAERLVACFGHRVRYCADRSCWLVWDGKRWRRDDTGEIERLAKQTVRSIYNEARAEPDSDKSKALGKHAASSEAAGRIRSMVELAKSELEVAIRSDELDADPWLFNCQNGTIDLRNGQLRPHRQADLITKMSPVHYDAGAHSKSWEHFLEDSTGGDEDLQAFLARAAGYSLTGNTGEEKFFFVHGPGGSGKSTFLQAIKAVMGEYAMTADFDSFTTARKESTKADIARLAGARLVTASESNKDARWDEGLVKMLTGGDTITARELYKSNFEFKPAFKLWLASNYAPRVSSGDAIWRRLVAVPFAHGRPEEQQDDRVKEELIDPTVSGPAILAWAVRGCLEWRKSRLGATPAVKKATADYKASQNPLAEFFEGCCVFEPGATVTRADLRKRYEAWTVAEQTANPLKAKPFTQAVRDSQRVTESKVRDSENIPADGWKGVRLQNPDEVA